jgi:predicted NAD/FAD-binding protein
MNRKNFIRLSLGIAGIGNFCSSCFKKKKLKGQIVGASASIGHLLRNKKNEPPGDIIKKKVVIVGGGVSGLSAARHLQQQGITDFILLDLEKEVGGNAAYGKNNVSAYPWGAHYIPIPNNGLTDYINFLKECNVITGTNNEGIPVYNDYYLCFDPEERLYVNGRWQEGIIPNYGVPNEENKQTERFIKLMDEFRHLKGSDGKDAFAIPVDHSSKDKSLTQLDSITMKQWLLHNGFTSSYLHRYVNYCTRDDFGTPHDQCSAWAGIHYFAGRKGKGTNAEHGDILTWPEGNGFLIQQLKLNIKSQLQNHCLATQVKLSGHSILVEYFDVKSNTIKAIEAEQCILAVPQFIATRLLQDEERSKKVKTHFHYAPWMVANLCVTKLEERSGAALSWDNVLHESESLGYVDATHQQTQQHFEKRNLTYYLPLTKKNPVDERKAAQLKTHEEWVSFIMDDLRKVHPNIEEATEEINIMVWGHAMAQTLPGMLHGTIRQELSVSIQNKIHFAHTDLAGISIFEEGFYQGLAAAKKVTEQLS